MSRSSQGAVNADSAGGAVAWRWSGLAAGCLALLIAAGSERRRSDHDAHHGRPRQHRDDARPILPRAALPGDRQRHRLPGQHRPGQLPFRVPRRQDQAWTLTLAQPTNSQRSFFNGFFGTPPEARLAILRRVPGTNPPRYNLRAQGSIHVLSPYLGQTVKFGASLKVEKGDIVGLTVPTWAPAFAQGLPPTTPGGPAANPANASTPPTSARANPRQKVGKRATYGCRYSTARLLYTATVVEWL